MQSSQRKTPGRHKHPENGCRRQRPRRTWVTVFLVSHLAAARHFCGPCSSFAVVERSCSIQRQAPQKSIAKLELSRPLFATETSAIGIATSCCTDRPPVLLHLTRRSINLEAYDLLFNLINNSFDDRARCAQQRDNTAHRTCSKFEERTKSTVLRRSDNRAS